MNKIFVSVGIPFVLLLSACAVNQAPHRSIPGVNTPENQVVNPYDVPQGQSLGLDGLGDFVAKTAVAIGRKPGVVAVFPALTPTPDTDAMHVTGLGELLMEQTALGLRALGIKSALSGSELKNDILAGGTSPASLNGLEDVYPIADLIEADYVIFGKVEHQVFDRLKRDDVLKIDWACQRTADRQVIAEYRQVLSGLGARELFRYHELGSHWLGDDSASRLPRKTGSDTRRTRTVNRKRLEIDLPRVRWNNHQAPRTKRHTAVVKVNNGAPPAAEGVMTKAIPASSRFVIGVPATPSAADRGKVFHTTGYFDRVEQAIEMTLTRMGLRVVDRTAFEAKLRQATAASDKDAPKYLRDAAELFQMARGTDLGADYMLQINTFDVGVGDSIAVNARASNSYQSLAQQVPEADLPSAIKLPGIFAQLNAKLIEIKTGIIVWNAICRADVRHMIDSNLIFKITIEKTSHDAQTPSRQDIESRLGQVRAAWDRVRGQLSAAYDSGQRRDIELAEKLFDDTLRSYRQLIEAVEAYKPRWVARYDVRIDPPAELADRSEKNTEALKRKLAKVAAGSLLESIEIYSDKSKAQPSSQINRNAELCSGLESEPGYEHLSSALWYADHFYHTVIDKPDLDLIDFPALQREGNARFPELVLQTARRHYLQYLSQRDLLPKFAWQENRTYRFSHSDKAREGWFELAEKNTKKITVLYEFKMDRAKLNVHREVRSTRGNVIERSRIFTSEKNAGAVAIWDGKEHALMEVSEPGERIQLEEPYLSIVHPGKGAKELFDFIRRGNY